MGFLTSLFLILVSFVLYEKLNTVTGETNINMSAVLLINPFVSSSAWSLSLLEKCRPSFFQGYTFHSGYKTVQAGILSRNHFWLEKRISQRTKPHTPSSSSQLSKLRREREKHEHHSIEEPPGENRMLEGRLFPPSKI